MPGPSHRGDVRAPAQAPRRRVKVPWLSAEEMTARARRQVAARSVAVQFGFFLVVLAIWWLPVPNPLKLLVVMFHELSHAAAAYLTGGVVFGMAVDPGGAGVTIGMGGHSLAVVSAGYVGSLAVGALLYWASTSWEPGEVWVVLLIVAGLGSVIGWLNDFSEVFAAGSMLILLAGLVWFPPALKMLLTRVLATASCLYPIIDVLGEYGAWLTDSNDGFRLRDRVIGSDVAELARVTGLPVGTLALTWCVAGIAAVVVLVVWSARREALTSVKASFRPGEGRRYRPPLYDPARPADAPEYTIR